MVKKAVNFALIPVRGGSKGIPNKNSRYFLHKPLVSWSIQQALCSKLIDRVFVSTDCAELAAISRDAGAEVPFMRPESFASDTASTELVIQHWLDWLSDNDCEPEYFTLLQATSPIRASGSIDSAIAAYQNSGADSLVTVTEFEGFVWRNQENPLPSYDVNARPRRQDIRMEDRLFVNQALFISLALRSSGKRRQDWVVQLQCMLCMPQKALKLTRNLIGWLRRVARNFL